LDIKPSRHKMIVIGCVNFHRVEFLGGSIDTERLYGSCNLGISISHMATKNHFSGLTTRCLSLRYY
jgi:hypothetical protein